MKTIFKKIIAIALILLAVFSMLLFVGCKKQDAIPAQPNNPVKSVVREYSMNIVSMSPETTLSFCIYLNNKEVTGTVKVKTGDILEVEATPSTYLDIYGVQQYNTVGFELFLDSKSYKRYGCRCLLKYKYLIP